MSTIEKLESWSELHHHKWMDALRMLLGFILHFKGLLFAFQTVDLMNTLQANFGSENAVLLAHILAFMHIFFGTLILIGLGTRFSCLVMMPVIIISIIFTGAHFDNSASQVILSLVVLFLLVFFFIEGSGKFSVTAYMSKSRRGRLRISDHPEKS